MQKLPLRRSPLYRIHCAQQAQFIERADAMVVSHYQSVSQNYTEQNQAKSLAICDLSGLSRIGFKGSDTEEWLRAQNVNLPGEANCACIGGDGQCIARLSNTEFLLLDGLANETALITSLRSNWSMEQSQRCYLLERADSHAWLALTGKHVPDLLSKVCAIDMRLHRFEKHQLTQTSVARTNAIVIRNDLGDVPCFYLLADLSAAEFLWDCLLDAMQEFDGQAVGLTALTSFL